MRALDIIIYTFLEAYWMQKMLTYFLNNFSLAYGTNMKFGPKMHINKRIILAKMSLLMMCNIGKKQTLFL